MAARRAVLAIVDDVDSVYVLGVIHILAISDAEMKAKCAMFKNMFKMCISGRIKAGVTKVCGPRGDFVLSADPFGMIM